MDTYSNFILNPLFTMLVLRMVLCGSKIQAIKLTRALLECSVRHAKDLVESVSNTDADAYGGFSPCSYTNKEMKFIPDTEIVKNHTICKHVATLTREDNINDAVMLLMSVTGEDVEDSTMLANLIFTTATTYAEMYVRHYDNDKPRW